jgi:hypothetical protein
VEYLRWLQQYSQLFLRPAYTEDDITQLPDSDGNNEVVNEYDEMTRHHTTVAWAVLKLRGKYFSVHLLSSFSIIEALIYD